MSTLPNTHLTPEQYLEIERKAEFRSEYYDGRMYAMSGGSRAHARIMARLAHLLADHMERRGCELYVADMRVLVEARGLYTYPDFTGVCGQPKFADSHVDTLLNPVILGEVLSPTTESYDRGTKARMYRAIPSLRECMLISQKAPDIELYRREEDGRWSIIEAAGLDASLELVSIGFILKLADLYAGILPAEADSAAG
jgi:Uma2 family endonuclease